jgi:hypothetical protein
MFFFLSLEEECGFSLLAQGWGLGWAQSLVPAPWQTSLAQTLGYSHLGQHNGKHLRGSLALCLVGTTGGAEVARVVSAMVDLEEIMGAGARKVRWSAHGPA